MSVRCLSLSWRWLCAEMSCISDVSVQLSIVFFLFHWCTQVEVIFENTGNIKCKSVFPSTAVMQIYLGECNKTTPVVLLLLLNPCHYFVASQEDNHVHWMNGSASCVHSVLLLLALIFVVLFSGVLFILYFLAFLLEWSPSSICYFIQIPSIFIHFMCKFKLCIKSDKAFIQSGSLIVAFVVFECTLWLLNLIMYKN